MKFTYKEREAKFSTTSGIVLSSQRHSETHIISSGGRSYVGPNGGYVNAPTVSSYSIDCHDFWIKTASGREVSVQLRDVNIPLREGQEITMLLVNKPDHDPIYAALVNKTTSQYYFLASAQELVEWTHLYKYADGTSFMFKTFGVWLISAIAASMLSLLESVHIPETATGITIVFVGFRMLKRLIYFRSNIEVEDMFFQKVDQVCKSLQLSPDYFAHSETHQTDMHN